MRDAPNARKRCIPPAHTCPWVQPPAGSAYCRVFEPGNPGTLGGVPAQMWASVPAQMWASVPAQMWTGPGAGVGAGRTRCCTGSDSRRRRGRAAARRAGARTCESPGCPRRANQDRCARNRATRPTLSDVPTKSQRRRNVVEEPHGDGETDYTTGQRVQSRQGVGVCRCAGDAFAQVSVHWRLRARRSSHAPVANAAACAFARHVATEATACARTRQSR